MNTISKDVASEAVTEVWTILKGLSNQLNVLYYDQQQSTRVMSEEEHRLELVDMLPALKGTVDACLTHADVVFNYLND